MSRDEIDRANAQFMGAFGRGDMAALAGLYTEDATLMPPNASMMKGRGAIEQFWAGARQMGVEQATLKTLELREATADTAIEIGRYSLRIKPAGGGEAADDGKYVVVWERHDGAWKLGVDIWNSDLPAAG